MLSIKDHTPIKFKLNKVSLKESIKIKIRKYIYPIYLFYKERSLNKTFDIKKKYMFDKIFLGQKGNDYEFHAHNLNKYKTISGSVMLVIGCGHGQDVERWLKYKPKKIIAIDYINYDRAWKIRKDYFTKKYNIEVEFLQADAEDLKILKDNSIDLVCSDAVYEHLKNLNLVLGEVNRVLKVRGVVYSTFGPLWYTFGGDMISGSDDLKNGFNHLCLNKDDYLNYFENTFKKNDYREFYFNNDFFSRLSAIEYFTIIEKDNYECLYKSCMLSERALKFKKLYPDKFNNLLVTYPRDDLIIESLSLIYVKAAEC